MWPRSPAQLVQRQRALAAAAPPPWQPAAEPPAVGACAVVSASDDRAWAAAAVMRGRRLLAEALVAGRAGAPYEPGLLALREGPLIEAAVRALPASPDVLLLDATGRDHPRRAGLALHAGAELGLPSVGVTHRPLVARGALPEEPSRGAATALHLDDEDKPVAAWVRTRAGARPVVAHPGWRTELAVAIAVVLGASRGHRTPEPLRCARRAARLARARASRAPEG
jgi:deoxyribonuclease V